MSQPVPVDRFTVAPDAGLDRVMATLEAWGLVRMPGFLDAATVAGLGAEFDRLLDDPAPWVRREDYKAGRAVSFVRARMERAGYPHVDRFLALDFARRVADLYLGPGNRLNDSVYFTHDQPRPFTINELHFDRIPTLKFFAYLTDTDQGNGALDAAPGSHSVSRRIRRANAVRGVRAVALPNDDVPAEVGPPQPIEGAAGTLIIFHTDVWHRGGQVAQGRERKVIRGHTLPREALRYNAPAWCRQWWRETANAVRYRVLGEADALRRADVEASPPDWREPARKAG